MDMDVEIPPELPLDRILMKEMNNTLKEYVKILLPDETEKEKFERLKIKLEKTVTTRYIDAELYYYGSFPSEIAVPGSDLDVGVTLETDEPLRTMEGIKRALEIRGFVVPRVLHIERRGQLTRRNLMGYDPHLKLPFDMSLNNTNGPLACSIVKAVASELIIGKQFIVLIKDFAKVQEVNKPGDGFMSSLGFCYMCIYILQRNNLLPKFHITEEIKDLEALDEALSYEINDFLVLPAQQNIKLIALLYDFFQFFSQFNFKEYVISVRDIAALPRKSSLGWLSYQMGIENPFIKENLGRSVREQGMKKLKRVFRKACMVLLDQRPDLLFQPLE